MADWFIFAIAMVIMALCVTMIVILPVLRMCSERVRLWCCRELGWHNGWPGVTGFDGASVHARCAFCGKAVMMDSQGGWFESG